MVEQIGGIINSMEKFAYKNTSISDLKIITPFYMEDDRGFFLKSIERDVYRSFGIDADIYEDFESYSKKGVIRGMHFQTNSPQAKIVRALTGKIYDVAVDLRKGSSTYGKWEGFVLSSENREILYIPKGFAHGFLVLSTDALVSYKCIGKYLNEYDTGIRWDDKDLAINWNIDCPIVSDKDKQLMKFNTFTDKFDGL